ncbi:MAG: PAS domain-containing sensor histidine kinase [Bacteriovorax sp.]|nr:PAS domain-containing sensor histidine kinase [Bacteriovorax sp.]
MPRAMEKNEFEIINETIDSIAAIFITDHKGHFVYVNEIFCQLTGYKSDELIGKSSNILKSGIHTDEFYKEFWRAIMSGEMWRGTFCNKTKTGELLWLDTIIKPIFNKNNEIEKFIGIRFNITDNVKNKFALKAQEEQLVAISGLATIGEISGFIAHEINNPLTAISLATNSIELSLNSKLPDLEKIKNLNSKIIKVSKRISRIVSSLRNLSRDEAHFEMQFHKPSEIVEDVLLIIEDIAKSEEIKLVIDSEIGNDLLIRCHKTQISQVLINLIKNACDAVQPLEKKEVKLTIKSDKEALEIRVLDTGTKIPDEVASCLFTPLFTTKKAGKGTGLGLTISAKIIEAHDGKLYLDNECDQTCFVVIIPLDQKKLL